MDSSPRTIMTSSVLNSLDLNAQDDIVTKPSCLSLPTPVKNVANSSKSKKKPDEDQENKLPENADGFVFKKPLPKNTMAKEDSNLDTIIDELNSLQLGGTSASERRFNLCKWSTPLKTRKIDSQNDGYSFHSGSSNSNVSETNGKEKSTIESDDAGSEYYDCSGEENMSDALSDPLNTTGSSFQSVHGKDKHNPISQSSDANATNVYTSEPVSEEKIAAMNENQAQNDAFILEKFLELSTSQWIDDQDFRLEISVDDVSNREQTLTFNINESLGNPSIRDEYEEIQTDPLQTDNNSSFDSVKTDSSEDVNTGAATIGSSENLLDDDIRPTEQLFDSNVDEFGNENYADAETVENEISDDDSPVESELKISSQDIASSLKTSSVAERNVGNESKEMNRFQENAFKFTFEPVSQQYSFPTTSFEMTQPDSYVPDMFCKLLEINTALPKSPSESKQYPSPIEGFANAFTTESPENLFLFPGQRDYEPKTDSSETMENSLHNQEVTLHSLEHAVDKIESINDNDFVNETVGPADSKESLALLRPSVNEDFDTKNDTPSDEIEEQFKCGSQLTSERDIEAQKSNDNLGENFDESVKTPDRVVTQADGETNETTKPELIRVIDEKYGSNDDPMLSDSPIPFNSNVPSQKHSSEISSIEYNEAFQLETTYEVDEHEHNLDGQSRPEMSSSSRSSVSLLKELHDSEEPNETFRLDVWHVIEENERDKDGQILSESSNLSRTDISSPKANPQIYVETNKITESELTPVTNENDLINDSQILSDPKNSSSPNISLQKHNSEISSTESNETFQLEATRVIDKHEPVDGQLHEEMNSSSRPNISSREDDPQNSSELNETFQLEVTRVIDVKEPSNQSDSSISPQKEILFVSVDDGESLQSKVARIIEEEFYRNEVAEEYDDMAMEVDEEITRFENRQLEIVNTEPDVFETSAMSICDVSTNIMPERSEEMPQNQESPTIDSICVKGMLPDQLTPNNTALVSGNITPLNSSNEMDETGPIDTTDMVTVTTDQTSQVMKQCCNANRLSVIPETNEETSEIKKKKDDENCTASNTTDGGIDAGVEPEVNVSSGVIPEGDLAETKSESDTQSSGVNTEILDMEIEPQSNPGVKMESQLIVNETDLRSNINKEIESQPNLNEETESQLNLTETIISNNSVNETQNIPEPNLNRTFDIEGESRENELELSADDSDQTYESDQNVTIMSSNHSLKEDSAESESKLYSTTEDNSKKPDMNTTVVLEHGNATETSSETENSPTTFDDEAESCDSSSTIEASPPGSNGESVPSPSKIPLSDPVCATKSPIVARESDTFVFKTPNRPKLLADTSVLNDSSFNADYRSETQGKTNGNSLISPKCSFYKSRQLYSPFGSPHDRKVKGTPKASGDVPTSLLDMSLGCFEQFTTMAGPQNTSGSRVVDVLNKTRDVDDEPQPEETKLLNIEEPTRMVNAKTQTHDTELDVLKIENDRLKSEVEELNRKFNEVLELARILHANETALKEACKQHEDNTRTLNNRYELLKEFSHVLISRRNTELDEAEAEIGALKAKLAESVKNACEACKKNMK